MNNTARITLTSFLAYFSMSSMLAPIGLVSAPMAAHFGIDVTQATEAFGALTTGILIGAVLALFVLDRAPLRALFCGLYASFTIALIIMSHGAELPTVRVCLAVIGIASGLGLPAAALTITATYNDAQRSSMLVMTDGAFSVAGFIMPLLTLSLIARGYLWSTIYIVAACITLLLILLAVFSRFPTPERDATSTDPRQWPASVWLIIGALFLYTLGQYAMTWWLPNHLTTSYDAAPQIAGKVVERFWQGMFIAQLLVAWWVLSAGTMRVLRIGAVTGMLGTFPLWLVTDAGTVGWLALLWGVANLGLLKMMLSFATQQIPTPSARLVSFILLGATCGTAVSPFVSSAIVANAGTIAVLWFASGCYVAMSALILIATRRSTA
ncbi:MAG: MFS transporter TsgA [Pseudomonadota bacterium]